MLLLEHGADGSSKSVQLANQPVTSKQSHVVMSLHMSQLSPTSRLAGYMCLQLFLPALRSVIGIQTRLLICQTFNMDYLCLYFHKSNKGFTGLKRVS